jgi:hypothetical protein
MRNLIQCLSIVLIASLFSIQLPAQETFLGSGGNGTGSGGTFSFSFGQFAYQTFFEASSSVEQGVQHPFEIDIVPSLFSLFDSTVHTGENSCFNALQNITVAGDGHPVTIQDRAVANFIAGQSIRFLPGFTAQSGSTVHGYITPDNNFCDGYLTSSIVQVPPEEKDVEIAAPESTIEDISPGMQVNLYPNPNNGRFKIDLINFENRATVSVYNLVGSVFYQSGLRQTTQNEINLPWLRKGIYFVRVTCDSKQFVKKIIVN